MISFSEAPIIAKLNKYSSCLNLLKQKGMEPFKLNGFVMLAVNLNDSTTVISGRSNKISFPSF
jgi:hypothetical protein